MKHDESCCMVGVGPDKGPHPDCPGVSLSAAPHEVVVSTPNLYRATVDAWYAVEKELDVDWTARKPIQGEATYKVFAYRIALATVEALIADGWSKADA